MAGLGGTAARLAAHLIEQMENDVDTRQVHFEFLGERADKAGALKRRCVVERFGATGEPGHRHRRDEFLTLPQYEFAFADTAQATERGPADERDLAAVAGSAGTRGAAGGLAGGPPLSPPSKHPPGRRPARASRPPATSSMRSRHRRGRSSAPR